jgi:hypothetical protein
MSLSGFLPAVSRRAITMGTIAVLAGVVSGAALKAQTTAPQTPAPAAQPAPADPLTFDSEVPRLVFISFTPDGAQAFEDAMKQAKDALAKSEKPERKQQAAHWKAFRSVEPDGTVNEFFQLDATVKGVSYNPFAIIYENLSATGAAQAQRDPVDALFKRVNAAIKGLHVFEKYTSLVDMSGGGGH